MGQIRKIGDTYYIEFHARGLMYSQIAGPDEAQARRMLEQIEAKIAGGEALTIAREIDLNVFFQRFSEEAASRFSAQSLRRFSHMWKHFRTFLEESFPNIRQLSQITPSVIESYKAHLAKIQKAKVINFTILLLREILEYGIKIGFINDNPSLHITLIPMPNKVMRTGRRLEMAKGLLAKGVSLGKMYEILKLKDVAQIIYWSNFIPLKREDVYN